MRLAQIICAPLVLLSESVDPSRTIVDDVLSSASARAFKVHEATSIPELLDESRSIALKLISVPSKVTRMLSMVNE